MIQLSDKQIGEFCLRSYTAVDGLWFMKVEEKYGFDKALEVDNEVWKVLPKIQARMLKSMGKMDEGIEALEECFTTKLALDGFTFKTAKTENNGGFRVTIKRCPWHDQMIKSGRQDLSDKIGKRICNTEYAVWAAEFSDNIDFKIQERICNGADSCILVFQSV